MLRWLTAFIDVPTDRFETTVDFWSTVTDTTRSATRGDRDQFVSLVPATGTDHLRVQALDGEPRIHLDLHVDSIPDAVDRAVGLGAELLAQPGHAILRSPGGFVFCFVDHGGRGERGPRLTDPVEHRADVVCIDVPAPDYETEYRFWSELTGQGLSPIHDDFPEFAGLALRHQGLPWNLLVQRLGADDGRAGAEAHLDVSAGEGFSAVADRHEALGAHVERRFDHWVILRDPAGLAYCITDRGPD
ncbi:MAG: VOC family protein [Actinomycetota bacterium]